MYRRIEERDGGHWMRVAKQTAERAYHNGFPVILTPAKIPPLRGWDCPIDPLTDGEDFGEAVEDAKLRGWDLLTTKSGRWWAYWLPVREVDGFTGTEPTERSTSTRWAYDPTRWERLYTSNIHTTQQPDGSAENVVTEDKVAETLEKYTI